MRILRVRPLASKRGYDVRRSVALGPAITLLECCGLAGRATILDHGCGRIQAPGKRPGGPERTRTSDLRFRKRALNSRFQWVRSQEGVKPAPEDQLLSSFLSNRNAVSR